jgi:hypothetical protein
LVEQAEDKPKRKSRGRGRSARQISLESGNWVLADECVAKGFFKDVSALFETAFKHEMEHIGMSLTVKVEEIASRKR